MFRIYIQNTFIFTKQSNWDLCRFFRKELSTFPQLSPYDINSILRENEYNQNFNNGAVKCYDSNQLGSNNPIEDSRSEATLVNDSGYLFGIFDGHAGAACSQVISKRLMRYLAASLIDREKLREIFAQGADSQSFLKCFNDKLDFVREIRSLYEKSFQKYIQELCENSNKNFDKHDFFEHAFLQLDDDMSFEALQYPNNRTLSVAMSGAVACVAYVEDRHLYVASTGDCSAVLGTVTDTGQWVPKKLNQEHNSDNIQEVQRILQEHPPNEKDTAIRNERLLGQLAPLRALGDFRYKWSNEILQKVVVPNFGEMSVPPHYLTPPYLTAAPEVTHHILNPNDRFLVIASDGLWDFLTPTQVVELVSEHMSARAYLQPLSLPSGGITLGEIADILAQRKAGRKKKPLDKNCATHLIRHALGGTEYGIEHSKLSHLLSLPQDTVRLFRDDITITIVYFDEQFLKNHQY